MPSFPEALAAVGADGVMLNHVERPLDEDALSNAIRRAHEAGLLALVGAEDVEQATRYAALEPDLILLEPRDLIGTANGLDRPSITVSNAAVANVNPNVLVLHGGGIADEHAARMIMEQGAAGTGCTTAIVAATDRNEAVQRMVQAVREGWNSRRDSAPYQALSNQQGVN